MIKSILHTSHKKDRGGKNPHDGVKSIFSDLLVQLGETFDMHSIIEPYSGGFTGITGWSRQKDAVWAAMSIIVQRLYYVKEWLWSQESHFRNYQNTSQEQVWTFQITDFSWSELQQMLQTVRTAGSLIRLFCSRGLQVWTLTLSSQLIRQHNPFTQLHPLLRHQKDRKGEKYGDLLLSARK